MDFFKLCWRYCPNIPFIALPREFVNASGFHPEKHVRVFGILLATVPRWFEISMILSIAPPRRIVKGFVSTVGAAAKPVCNFILYTWLLDRFGIKIIVWRFTQQKNIFMCLCAAVPDAFRHGVRLRPNNVLS